MGYTNYWTFNLSAIPKGKTQEIEAKYQKAILECQTVLVKLAEYNREVFGTSGMSGYSAHTKPGVYGGIQLNGNSSAGAAEDFVLREHLKQNDIQGFCKTNRHLYDIGVQVCLLILKYRLGELIHIGCDDTARIWEFAANFSSEVLKRKIKVPQNIADNK
jgi:hypothetical protein